MINFILNKLRTLKFRITGNHTYGKIKVRRYGSKAKVTIGNFCSIASGVEIILTDGQHKSTKFSNYPFGMFYKEFNKLPPNTEGVKIGNDVWIGHRATILAGVTIGNGAVIGARSVVAKDVEPYTIVAGNPAREVKKRENPNCEWWNWDIKKIYEIY